MAVTDGVPVKSIEEAREASGEISSERRTERRIPIGLRVVEIDGETTYFQYATNLSAGGLYLDGTLPHPPGTRVTLMFLLPGDRSPTRVEAEVVGPSDPHRGLHVRFLADPDSDLRRRLRELVAARAG